MNRSEQTSFVADGGPAVLSIGEVAARTGMTVAGLRNWEVRYGIPTPQRTPSGQRRYRESDCRLITDILRRRDSGVVLSAAIHQAREAARFSKDSSIYAAMRRRHPQLPVHKVDKRMLLALTWAIEDHCCSAAESPLLVGAFQKTEFYQSARRRWRSMATTGDYTIVFADFNEVRMDRDRLAEVPISLSSPLQREWALICDSPELPACVLGWEPPGQKVQPDAERIFEMVWSVDPQVVRQAARIAVEIAAETIPNLAVDLAQRIAEEAPPASRDLQRASGLLERTLDYLAQR